MNPITALLHSSPDVLGGTPVFAGARVLVQNLTDYVEAGDNLDGFSSISREQAWEFWKSRGRLLLPDSLKTSASRRDRREISYNEARI